MQVSGIRRKSAEKAEQGPSADFAHEIENDVAHHHGEHADPDDEIEVQISIGSDGAGGEDGECGGQGKTNGLGEAYQGQEQVAVVRDG